MQIQTSTMVMPPRKTTANAGAWLLIAMVAATHVAAAHAALGGDRASIEADRLHMQVKQAARVTASAAGSYSVAETTLPSGTRVRQYTSGSGLVFAVTWSGPFMPDLRQLLGPHFNTMITRQAGLTLAGRRFFNLHQPDLVIESGGHPRSFAGRAYLPGALPAGVTAQEIR